VNARELRKGDLLDIQTDKLSQKAPCTCTVVGKRPRGLVVEHDDSDEYLPFDLFTDKVVERLKDLGGRRIFKITERP